MTPPSSHLLLSVLTHVMLAPVLERKVQVLHLLPHSADEAMKVLEFTLQHLAEHIVSPSSACLAHHLVIARLVTTGPFMLNPELMLRIF